MKERQIKRLKKKIRKVNRKARRNKHNKKQLLSKKQSLQTELEKIKPTTARRFELIESRSTLKKFAVQYTVDGVKGYDPKTFLSAVRETVINFLKEHRNIKFKLILKCNMTKTNIGTGEVIHSPAAFQSNVEINLESTDLNDIYAIAVGKMLESLAAFQMQGSNWIFDSIIGLELHTVKYKPLNGSSFIQLPEYLRKKKAIINIQNKDNECFKWCILRHLHPTDNHPERVSSLKQYENELDLTNINFPMKLSDITKFENRNKIFVNVYGYEEGNIYPLRFSKKRDVVNLLLINHEEISHHCLIKNFSSLVSMQVSKHNERMFFCGNCVQHYNKEIDLLKHEEYCWENKSENIIMPEIKTKEGKTIMPEIKFINHKHNEKNPIRCLC